MYIWECSDWPEWRYDIATLTNLLSSARYRQGCLKGQMEALGFHLRDEAYLRTLTMDVLKTSEIEGEHFDRELVRSSIARQLGMTMGALAPEDRHVEGLVAMMLDATQNYASPITTERLFTWHGAIFPTGRSGMMQIRVGDWRNDAKGPMQVVSGRMGYDRVHYKAPPADCLKNEMAAFLLWVEAPDKLDMLLKAGIAHLWFVTLHPFDDGNGRIARAISDLLLARSDGMAQRFFSMSAQIQHERNDYYSILERTQRGDMDITEWLQWFLECLERAVEHAKQTLNDVLYRARFWEGVKGIAMNERHIKVLQCFLGGFEGKLTTSKWAKIAKCSQDTAYRDILALIRLGVLIKKEAGGRSTSYEIAPF